MNYLFYVCVCLQCDETVGETVAGSEIAIYSLYRSLLLTSALWNLVHYIGEYGDFSNADYGRDSIRLRIRTMCHLKVISH